MAVKYSLGLRNFINSTGVATAFDTNGLLAIYAGSVPADPDAAIVGTLLATLTLSADAFGSTDNGVLTANAITSDTNIDASGTAAFFVIYNNGDTALSSAPTTTPTTTTADRRLIGTVTAIGGGGDLEMSSTNFVAGGTVAVSSLTITMPSGA